MKVRCIDDSDSMLSLDAGKVYEVVAEYERCYGLRGVHDSWRKARFEVVPGEKPVEMMPVPVDEKTMTKIAVVTKYERCYGLRGVHDSWRKARFEVVPGEKPVEMMPVPVDEKTMTKIAFVTKLETHTVNEYHVVLSQKEMVGLQRLFCDGTSISTIKKLGLQEFEAALEDLGTLSGGSPDDFETYAVLRLSLGG